MGQLGRSHTVHDSATITTRPYAKVLSACLVRQMDYRFGGGIAKVALTARYPSFSNLRTRQRPS
jgi:hypothetical protein